MKDKVTIEFLANYLVDLQEKKDADYNRAFDRSLDEDGLLVAKIRLGDKLKRFCSLINPNHEQKISDERIEDTLIDLAAYSLMTIRWIYNNKKESEGDIEFKEQVGKFRVDFVSQLKEC